MRPIGANPICRDSRRGIGQWTAIQQESLGEAWPFRQFRPRSYEPGFFIPQLCRISTLPSEISDQPSQSGGRMVFLIAGSSD